MVPRNGRRRVVGHTRPASAPSGTEASLYFTSGDGTKKSRDSRANPSASISVSLPGMDLVFEGTVEKVTDRPTLEALVKAYNESGWPASLEGDAFTAPYSAPSAGPPPWKLYRFDVRQGHRRRFR